MQRLHSWLLVGLCLAVPLKVWAQRGEDVEVYPYGTIDVQMSTGDDRARELNRQRRGNSPFSHIVGNLFADVAAGDRLVVFNHLIVDPTSRAPLSSFLRTWVRYTAVQRDLFDLHVQAGKIPTPFGHFTERSYSDSNPLLGYPLMYHYSSSLRSGLLPSGNDELLAHRGQGSPESFSGYGGEEGVGAVAGLPMVYDSCWDFGGGIIGSFWRFEYLLAITTGSLSDPKTNGQDNNDGVQLAGRLGVVPFPGMQLRLSVARAPYLDEDVASGLLPGQTVEDFEQRIVGLSAQYEWRHLSLTGEWAANAWESPHIVGGAGTSRDLTVDGFYAEGRYKLAAGWFVAARYSGLRYGSIPNADGQSVPWDWDVDRHEVGTGYWITDGVLVKLAAQINDIEAPGVDRASLLSSLLVVRF